MTLRPRAILLSLVLAGLAGPALAQNAEPAPGPFQSHYVSQRADKAYMREGPSFDHKVVWVYQHKGYPLLVTASFDVWRRVMDLDGTVGWMSAQMLTDNRTVLVIGEGRAQILKTEDPGAKVVGMADPGAILALRACTHDSCRAHANGIDGWIPKSRLWGVTADEVFK